MATASTVLIEFSRRNALLISGAVLVLFIGNVLNVLLPLSIGVFYELELHESGPKAKLMHWFPIHFAETRSFLYGFLLLVLLRAVFVFFERFCSGLVGERLARSLRERLFSTQIRYTATSFAQRPVGKYLLRYSGDLQAVQQWATQGILVFTGDLFFIGAAFLLLASISVQLTLVFAAVMACGALLTWFMGKKQREYTRRRRNRRSKNLEFVHARLSAFQTIKAFNRENPEQKGFDRNSWKLYKIGLKYQFWAALAQAMMPLFYFGALGLMMFLLTDWRADKSVPHISRAQILIVILLTLYMRAALRRLMQVNIIWQSGWLSFQKLISLIHLPVEARPDEPQDEPMPETPAETTGTTQCEIQIEDLGFSYQPDRQIFTNLSLRLVPATITLLKGPQGAGKTTFIKLLLCMYTPAQGRILINGVDYKDLTPFEIRKKIAVVSEDMPLLGNTVFEAVAYRPTPERRERTAKMLEQLGLNFAADPDAALAFELNSGAANISAGDRAMLQVARALLTRKKILLLDEPFKQLDAAHEQILVKRLQKLKPTHTILLVANNIPTGLSIDQTIDLQHLTR